MSTRSDPKKEQHQQAQALLEELLGTPTATGNTTLRPVQLRSRAEQRHIALRSFLQRTWFDSLLQHTERLLLLTVLGVFVYWLLDGYGRDWLHEFQEPSAQAASVPLPALAQPTLPTNAGSAAPISAAAVERPAQRLPFTTPDMEQPEAADYLVPGSLVAPALPSDLRPRRLVVPQIELDTPVVEVFVLDGAWQVADYAAGYHNGSALPGNMGNMVMAGHAGLRGAVFRDLPSLNPGSELFVEAGGWRYRYRVREINSVLPNQIEVLNPTATAVLTLITCTAWDTQRLVVVADLVDSLPLPGGL